jgi:hypothetical protein
MVTQFDAKGKIFTQVVSKEPVMATIQTGNQTIRGCIHVRPDARVKDELNGQDQFIAVTDAVVYNDQKDEIYRCNFLVVNTNHIVWVIPEEEFTQ